MPAGCLAVLLSLNTVLAADLGPAQSVAGNTELTAVTVSAAVEPPVSATPTTLVDRGDIQFTPGANRTNSLAMITDYVPGAYVVHDQLHVRGGHQTTWAIDGVEIPNTNIASNLGPQIDPKDIDHMEIQRGSYEADFGDRTYGVFNIVPRTGFEYRGGGELLVSAGNYGQTNDYVSYGDHSDELAYYASLSGNRSDLGIETPVAQVIHDAQYGYGGFGSLVYSLDRDDQLRLVLSARRDAYQIPIAPGDLLDDTQREADAFAILSWAHDFSDELSLTSSVFFHYNRADYDGAPDDFPISTTDQRSSEYFGGQEALRWHWNRNDFRAGVLGWGQQDSQLLNVVFNDGSNAPVFSSTRPDGHFIAAFVQDAFEATNWLRLMAGVRQTFFSGNLSENATSPRLGAAIRLPGPGWILRGFWGKFYQVPPLDTVSGPLLQYVSVSDTAFLPLRGERDTEYQYGLTIPLSGWTVDIDRFRTEAANYFDHNAIGNSNAYLPLTIDGAVIVGTELTVRSPPLWRALQVHVAYSNQTADGFGAVNGGLTDFSPPTGSFALDHDQRNTLNAGFEAHLPYQSFASANLYYGSGFANGGEGSSHLPSHAELDLSVGRSFGQRLTASVTALNVTNQHLLIDDSETFGGFHYNAPLQIYAQLQYRFGH
jgi:hypothetical protein